MHLAPIGLSAYNRINHIKRTVEALRSNTLATQSDLYIFSDAPKPGDEAEVAIVREYLHTIDNFKSVNIIERSENSRVANNRGGIKMLLEQHGKCIFVEEDIITAPGFLQFMNDALVHYKNNDQILSVTGYCQPITIPKSYSDDVYFLKRFCAWGFGIWKDKYEIINPVSKEQLDLLKSDKKKLPEFEMFGDDLLYMLEKEVNGQIDALDVKAMYWQNILNLYTVYPRQSLTQNIGCDGSGIHCGKTDKFDVPLWDKTENFNMPFIPKLDRDIVNSNKKLYSFGKIYWLKRKLKTRWIKKKILDGIHHLSK
jgi:hypothetical protein